MKISLTEFVDFTLESGAGQVRLVREVKERAGRGYDVRSDWYKQLREQIIELHRTGRMEDAALDEWLALQPNERKMPSYVSRVGGFKIFLAGKTLTWFSPPTGRWTDGDLEVRINPELGLIIDGIRTVVKLHLKAKAFTADRAESAFALMDEELRPKVATSTRFAVLEVATGRLVLPNPKWDPSDMRALLRAQAQAFQSLWGNI
jgi:hypothetical protein